MKEERERLQRFLGSCLMGGSGDGKVGMLTDAEGLYFSGKTKVISLMLDAFGEYASQIPKSNPRIRVYPYLELKKALKLNGNVLFVRTHNAKFTEHPRLLAFIHRKSFGNSEMLSGRPFDFKSEPFDTEKLRPAVLLWLLEGLKQYRLVGI